MLVNYYILVVVFGDRLVIGRYGTGGGLLLVADILLVAYGVLAYSS